MLVSVRNSLQPCFINDAATEGGEAAIAGEMEKDEKHQDHVESHGRHFYPLVVKCLGTWSPSSLDILSMAPRRFRGTTEPELHPKTTDAAHNTREINAGRLQQLTLPVLTTYAHRTLVAYAYRKDNKTKPKSNSQY